MGPNGVMEGRKGSKGSSDTYTFNDFESVVCFNTEIARAVNSPYSPLGDSCVCEWSVGSLALAGLSRSL